MAGKRPPSRARTARRELARAEEKLRIQRERLFQLEPGGTPERPIEVETVAVIEVKAASLACPACGGRVRVQSHEAPTIRGVRLREVRVRCTACGRERSLWFRLVPKALH
ncbi:MAG TPA: hypothetical protein VKY73_10895 [Polyangiaceae bacterium]|nr:hypothetical protein [Polyangiaceae bacterium]